MMSLAFHLIDVELGFHIREDEILHPLTMLAQRAVQTMTQAKRVGEYWHL